jgi:hypothetical protein
MRHLGTYIAELMVINYFDAATADSFVSRCLKGSTMDPFTARTISLAAVLIAAL